MSAMDNIRRSYPVGTILPISEWRPWWESVLELSATETGWIDDMPSPHVAWAVLLDRGRTRPDGRQTKVWYLYKTKIECEAARLQEVI